MVIELYLCFMMEANMVKKLSDQDDPESKFCPIKCCFCLTIWLVIGLLIDTVIRGRLCIAYVIFIFFLVSKMFKQLGSNFTWMIFMMLCS